MCNLADCRLLSSRLGAASVRPPARLLRRACVLLLWRVCRDLTNGQCRVTCSHDDAVTHIEWAPNGEPFIFSSSVDKTLKSVQQLIKRMHTRIRIRNLAISAGGLLLGGSARRALHKRCVGSDLTARSIVCAPLCLLLFRVSDCGTFVRASVCARGRDTRTRCWDSASAQMAQPSSADPTTTPHSCSRDRRADGVETRRTNANGLLD